MAGIEACTIPASTPSLDTHLAWLRRDGEEEEEEEEKGDAPVIAAAAARVGKSKSQAMARPMKVGTLTKEEVSKTRAGRGVGRLQEPKMLHLLPACCC